MPPPKKNAKIPYYLAAPKAKPKAKPAAKKATPKPVAKKAAPKAKAKPAPKPVAKKAAPKKNAKIPHYLAAPKAKAKPPAKKPVAKAKPKAKPGKLSDKERRLLLGYGPELAVAREKLKKAPSKWKPSVTSATGRSKPVRPPKISGGPNAKIGAKQPHPMRYEAAYAENVYGVGSAARGIGKAIKGAGKVAKNAVSAIGRKMPSAKPKPTYPKAQPSLKSKPDYPYPKTRPSHFKKRRNTPQVLPKGHGTKVETNLVHGHYANPKYRKNPTSIETSKLRKDLAKGTKAHRAGMAKEDISPKGNRNLTVEEGWNRSNYHKGKMEVGRKIKAVRAEIRDSKNKKK